MRPWPSNARIGPPGLAPAAFLVALTLVLPAGESRAFRDGGCFWPPGIPRPRVVLGGVRLPGDDPDAALAVAERLGIGTRACREGNGWWMEGAQLGPTALMWGAFGLSDAVFGVPTPGVFPLLHPMADWGCPWYAPMTAEQPTGALQVVRVNALVSDLESTWQAWGWAAPLSFGAPFDIPWLDARAREARVENGSLRMITPVDPDGLAARWLADGGPRWLGFTLVVRDLAHAADALEGRGVRLLHATEWKRPLLAVEPDQAGGTLVEFVEGAPF